MNLKKNGKLFTSKFVGTGPSSYKRRIYHAAVSQRLRNTEVDVAILGDRNVIKKEAKKILIPYNMNTA